MKPGELLRGDPPYVDYLTLLHDDLAFFRLGKPPVQTEHAVLGLRLPDLGYGLSAERRPATRPPGQRPSLDDQHPLALSHPRDDRFPLLRHTPAFAASRALKTVSASRMAATSWVRM
jgi:hypothetical protein